MQRGILGPQQEGQDGGRARPQGMADYHQAVVLGALPLKREQMPGSAFPAGMQPAHTGCRGDISAALIGLPIYQSSRNYVLYIIFWYGHLSSFIIKCFCMDSRKSGV